MKGSRTLRRLCWLQVNFSYGPTRAVRCLVSNGSRQSEACVREGQLRSDRGLSCVRAIQFALCC